MDHEQKSTNKTGLKKTWILVTFLVAITGILLIISLTSKSPLNKPEITPTPIKTDMVKSTLLVSEDIQAGSKSGTFEVDIIANPNGNKITVAQLEMSYDPKVLRNVDIKPGSFFLNPTIIAKKIDSTNGTIKYWITNPANQTGITNEGVVAVITFSKSSNTSTPLNFLPKTALSASGSDRSVLKQTVSGIIGTLPSPVKITPATKRYISPFPTKIQEN